MNIARRITFKCLLPPGSVLLTVILLRSDFASDRLRYVLNTVPTL